MGESAERDVSRRRFLSLLALGAAGTAAAASLPVAGEAVVSKLLGNPTEMGEDDPGGPEPIPWEARRRMMLRAHEDAVLHTDEGGSP